jgi:hypothetical protein
MPLYSVRIRVWWANVRVATQGDVSGATTGGLGVKAASLSPPPPGRPTTCNRHEALNSRFSEAGVNKCLLSLLSQTKILLAKPFSTRNNVPTYALVIPLH